MTAPSREELMGLIKEHVVACSDDFWARIWLEGEGAAADAILARIRGGWAEALEERALTAAAFAIADLYRGDGGFCGLEAAREQARVTLVAYQRALPSPPGGGE